MPGRSFLAAALAHYALECTYPPALDIREDGEDTDSDAGGSNSATPRIAVADPFRTADAAYLGHMVRTNSPHHTKLISAAPSSSS